MKLRQDSTRRAPFVPHVYDGPSTVFVIPREKFTASRLEPMLASLGVPEGPDRRQRADDLIRWQDMPVDADAVPLEHAFHDGGLSMRWKLHIFNALNRECRLPSYDERNTCLSLVVPFEDLTDCPEPVGYNSGKQPYDALVSRHRLLNRMIEHIHLALESDFVFGNFWAQLYIFCSAFHVGRKPMPAGADFSDYFWPWAVYPPRLKRRVTLEKIEGLGGHVSRGRHPYRLFAEELRDGSVLVFTATPDFHDYQYEEEAYAGALGLKPVTSIRLKRVY